GAREWAGGGRRGFWILTWRGSRIRWSGWPGQQWPVWGRCLRFAGWADQLGFVGRHWARPVFGLLFSWGQWRWGYAVGGGWSVAGQWPDQRQREQCRCAERMFL